MVIFIIIGLIILNGLFSMSEIAVISARKSSLANESKHGNKSAKAALKLTNEPNRFLSTIQLGITLIGILTGMYSGDILGKDFSIILQHVGIPPTISYTLGKTIIVIIVTYLSLIFGELVPKRIGMGASEKIAKLIARPMNVLSLIATPFVWFLSKSTSLVTSLLNIKESKARVTEEEIRTIVHEGTIEGEVKEVEQDIVDRVFSLGDRSLASIMTYRNEVVWIDTDMTNDEIFNLVKDNLLGVYPVASKNIDNILGVVYIKDLFGKIGDPDFKIDSVIKPARFFYETMAVYKALEQMKSGHIKFAMVCDEFGSIEGVVTLRDILEGLVGSIPDAYDEPEIVKREDGSLLVDGQCPFYDFLDYVGMEDLYSQHEYNTISGLILQLLEHIPHSGEIINWKNFKFEIADMDGSRIDKVIVHNKRAATDTINEND